MDASQINSLLKYGKFPVDCQDPELMETHISWIILCEKIVFKIKKPVQYEFLDFSTLEKRNYYCTQEILLNRRLVDQIYLGMVYIVAKDEKLEICLNESDNTIEYAVMMKRMDSNRRMDKLLKRNAVTLAQVTQIAEVLKDFHEKAEVIYRTKPLTLQHNFNDLDGEKNFISSALGEAYGNLIDRSIKQSDTFLKTYESTLKMRSELGFIKDCHGDLHSKNIFLLDKPVIFDCIEFNPEIRQIDILNELAFFCMDLEAFDQKELSEYFMVSYTKLSPTIRTEQEQHLFIYYKAYHANVRAKINALQAKDLIEQKQQKSLSECKKYLDLMRGYMNIIR